MSVTIHNMGLRPRTSFSTNLVHLERPRADHGLKSRGGPAHHLTGVLLINLCNAVTMVYLDFLSDVPSLCYDLISCLWWSEPSYIMRLSDILNLPLLWRLESYYIIMNDTIWHNFREMHVSYDHMTLKAAHDCLAHMFAKNLALWHAWPLTLPPHIVMIMHEHENELKTPVQWTWHDVPNLHRSLLQLTAGHAALTRHTVCKKIFQLDMPY